MPTSREEPDAERPFIEVTRNEPYIVHNLMHFRNSKGVFIETLPLMALCRCGHSGTKPFCNGTHVKIGFIGDTQEGRVPDRLDAYAGRGGISPSTITGESAPILGTAPTMFPRFSGWTGNPGSNRTAMIQTIPQR